jgi:hypothetical protein
MYIAVSVCRMKVQSVLKMEKNRREKRGKTVPFESPRSGECHCHLIATVI